MKTSFMRVLSAAKGVNDALAERIARVTAWRIWMNVVAIGTAVWLAVDVYRNHGLNAASAGLTLLVLFLTIQTSIDAQGQRFSQREQRDIEKKRDFQFATQLSSIPDLTTQIRSALDRLVAGDAEALERDTNIRNLIVRLLDAVEEKAAIAAVDDKGVNVLAP